MYSQGKSHLLPDALTREGPGAPVNTPSGVGGDGLSRRPGGDRQPCRPAVFISCCLRTPPGSGEPNAWRPFIKYLPLVNRQRDVRPHQIEPSAKPISNPVQSLSLSTSFSCLSGARRLFRDAPVSLASTGGLIGCCRRERNQDDCLFTSCFPLLSYIASGADVSEA